MARKYKVEGFKNVAYTSKKTGKDVKGTTLYVSAEPNTPDVQGREVKEVWVGQYSTYRPAVGDTIGIFYDERGRVDEVISYAGK